MKPVSVKNAEHYQWGEECDGWHLLKSSDLSVIEERMPAGAKEVMHYHEKSQQLFYVLEGEATMKFENSEVTLSEGESLHIPPNVSHQMTNLASEPLRFLVVSQPISHGDRVTIEK